MFQIKLIDRMDNSGDWTVLGNDTVNLADSTVRILGKYSLEFDKTNGTDDSTIAGAYREIALNLDGEGAQLHDKLQWAVYLSALTNVANCFVKLGTDASNNNQYLVADTSLRTGWTLCTAVLGEPYAINGTGWDPLDIKYMAVGVTFDAETDALADVKIDSVVLVPSRYTEDNTEITMDGVSVEANLDALEVLVAASNVLLGTIDADTGNIATDIAALEVLLAVGTGVMTSAQAVTLATDDTQFGAVGAASAVAGGVHAQLRAASEALEIIDNIIGTQNSAAPAGVANVGGEYEASRTEQGDGDIAAIAINAFRAIISAAHDESQGVDLVQDISAVTGVPFKATIAQLTAAGNSAALNVEGYLNHTMAVTIAAIQTSVEYHFEGSIDGGTVFDNLDAPGVTETETANDILLYRFVGAYTHVRIVFDAEVGGTNVTLDGRYIGSN